MNILLCGANGFIGRHLYQALTAAGHYVVRGVRTRNMCSDFQIDYVEDVTVEPWMPRLTGIDAVINAVGIISEEGTSTFNALHRDAPIALFEACLRSGVRRVVQISALGGDTESAMTPYMRSKREADAYLMSLPLEWIIFRPSLIVGADGESSKLFRTFASLPIIGLPGKGEQPLQPVHIDDLCAAVVAVLATPGEERQVIDAVGPEPMTYRTMLESYRDAMKLKEPVWLPIPMALMRFLAKVAAWLPQRIFSADTLTMLEQGNTADPARFMHLVDRPLKDRAAWFPGVPGEMLRSDATWRWIRPAFQLALALVWIITGFLSLGIYPVEDSYALLAEVGLTGGLAVIALYGAALMDIGLGIATLLYPARWLWRFQLTVILAYMVIITFFLPEFWLHPFGPILKNIPILALLIALDATEGK